MSIRICVFGLVVLVASVSADSSSIRIKNKLNVDLNAAVKWAVSSDKVYELYKKSDTQIEKLHPGEVGTMKIPSDIEKFYMDVDRFRDGDIIERVCRDVEFSGPTTKCYEVTNDTVGCKEVPC